MNLPNLLEFWRDEGGATAIEYALIASVVSVGIIASVNALGTALNGVFTDWSTAVAAAHAS